MGEFNFNFGKIPIAVWLLVIVPLILIGVSKILEISFLFWLGIIILALLSLAIIIGLIGLFFGF